jgi:hypothetical protein
LISFGRAETAIESAIPQSKKKKEEEEEVRALTNADLEFILGEPRIDSAKSR